MTLPDDVRAGVERTLSEHGLGRRAETIDAVGGGCINHGARLVSDLGATLFLKWNRDAPAGMFEAEADGLRAMAAAAPLRVPEPIAWSDAAEGTGWLLMEHVPSGSPSLATQQALGRGLAEMHTTAASDEFGWERDNWIGSLEQANGPLVRWGEFWRDRRLLPQVTLARGRGRAADPEFDRLLEVVAEALADVTRPALLHGDLWGGNWFAGPEGVPVLIDPAVYRGHGEVDLAMSELFGGFGRSFYDAYDEVHGISAEYQGYRRDMYQLYYLLVHVNLFGGAYEAGSLRAAKRVLAALG